MGTVLLVWELGGGIGHLRNLRPIGTELAKRGHRVFAAVRDLSKVRETWQDSGIAYMAAPIVPRHAKVPFEPTISLAHILGNIGFAHEAALETAFCAWNTLFDVIQPDLVVADHSPSALLALWGRPIKRVNVGIGFFCPPANRSLPYWARVNGPTISPQKMLADENEKLITATANRVLSAHRRPRVARLSDIFNHIDEVFLATYRELDHFGPRKDVRYWGHWPFGPGIEPAWPQGEGPKIYAYLKPFRGVEDLLAAIKIRAAPTLILAGDLPTSIQEKYTCATMRFVQQPLGLQQVARLCDLAILNANHGTTAALLLAGKPCLLIPLFLEQALFAQKIEQLGAGKMSMPGTNVPVSTALDEMLSSGMYRQRAEAFAQSYTAFTPGEQIPELVNHLEALIPKTAILKM